MIFEYIMNLNSPEIQIFTRYNVFKYNHAIKTTHDTRISKKSYDDNV